MGEHSTILASRGLGKSFGALQVNRNINLDVRLGEALAIIGPNGAGKTTLINQIAGAMRPDEGQILFLGQNITGFPAYRMARLGIGRSFQRTTLFPEFTVFENMRLAAQSQLPGWFHIWRPASGWEDINDAAMETLETVGLAGRSQLAAGALSHGEQRQLELGMALALRPQLLLLDEPMAGMSLDESLRITELLLKLKGKITLVLVEHDMDAVFAIADRIAVLVYGELLAVGDPETIRNDPAVVEAYLGEG